jgi:UDP-N-acetyl-D-mannosaminuronate dehydrogenase
MLLTRWGIALTQDLESAVKGADVVIISTDHSAYRIKASVLLSLMNSQVVVDARGVLTPDADIYSIDSGRWP